MPPEDAEHVRGRGPKGSEYADVPVLLRPSVIRLFEESGKSEATWDGWPFRGDGIQIVCPVEQDDEEGAMSEIRWRDRLGGALEEGRDRGKPLLLDFWTPE